jgi:hypothetical protein
MYAGANMGYPSREEGFVLCSKRSAAEEQHLRRYCILSRVRESS